MFKKADTERKIFKKLCQQRFSCHVDAQQAVELWRTKQVYSDVISEIKTVPIYGKKGQPKKDQIPDRIEALVMVIISCLMAYASLEHQVRKNLKEKALYFPE